MARARCEHSSKPAPSQLHQPHLLDLPDRQHRPHRVYLLIGGELLYDEVLEAGEVFGDAVEQEVAVAGDHPGLADHRPFAGRGGEGLEVGFRLVLEADHAEGDEVVAERGSVQHRRVALDDARLLQLAHAAKAGRGGNAGPGGQLHIGHPAIGLQFLQDADVDGVEFGTKHGSF